MMDPLAALRVLVAHEVRFVLIGGQAARALGSSSLTNDVDVCYDRAPDNLERLAAALTEMHARLRGVDEEVPFVLDARTLRNGDSFTFETDHGALDVLATPSGTTGYTDLVAGAEPMDLGDLTVHVVALDDLIRMKRAAARPKDRIEIEVLVALRDAITERS